MISLFMIRNVVSLFVIRVVLLFVLRNVVFVSSAKIPLFKKVDKRNLRFLLCNVVVDKPHPRAVLKHGFPLPTGEGSE